MSTKAEQLKKRFIELSGPLECIPTGEKTVLKKLNDIRVAIFDFYGTLCISGVGDIGIDDGTSDGQLLLDSLNGAGIEVKNRDAGARGLKIYNRVVSQQITKLEKQGIPYPEPDIRVVWQQVLDDLQKNGLISNHQQGISAEQLSVEFEARMNPVWPMPDMNDTLSKLHQRGHKLGIISNSQFYTPLALEALSGKTLDEHGFDQSLLHWSFSENRKKPGLAFYRHFLNKAQNHIPGLKPGQILFTGNDMLKDVWPASQLGMKTALFAGDKRSLKWRRDDERTQKTEPDLVITELNQLLECI